MIDIARGPLLLELNARPGLAIQVANQAGLLPRIRQADRIAGVEQLSCERTTAHRARAVLSADGAALLAARSGACRVAAASPLRWDVTVAIHVTGGTGAPMHVRLALPADTETQQIGALEVAARGLEATVVRDPLQPYRRGARRVERLAPHRGALCGLSDAGVVAGAGGPTRPGAGAGARGVPGPSPLFQSRSILVRDFLSRTSARARRRRQHRPDARDLPSDPRAAHLGPRRQEPHARRAPQRHRQARRASSASSRPFCAARIFRPVWSKGMNLNSTTRRKRVFWTEVWAQNRWWPVSASRGWVGREPYSYVAVTRDGQRVLAVDGPSPRPTACRRSRRRPKRERPSHRAGSWSPHWWAGWRRFQLSPPSRGPYASCRRATPPSPRCC